MLKTHAPHKQVRNRPHINRSVDHTTTRPLLKFSGPDDWRSTWMTGPGSSGDVDSLWPWVNQNSKIRLRVGRVDGK